MAGYTNYLICIESKVYLKSNGNEIAEFILIILLALLISALAVFIYSGKLSNLAKRFNTKINSENYFNTRKTTVGKTKKEIKTLLMTDNNVSFELIPDLSVSFKLPKPYQNNSGHTDNSYNELNNYLKSLSYSLLNLSNNKNIDNDSVIIVSKEVSDIADLLRNIYNKKNKLLSNDLFSEDPNLSNKLLTLLENYQDTLFELTDEGYNADTNQNNSSNSKHYFYLRDLKLSQNKLIQDETLNRDLKLILKITTDQIIKISKNTNLTISEKEYANAKKAVIKLIIKSNLEYSIKDNLLNALNTKLLDNQNAKILILSLKTVLSSNPESFDQLDSDQKKLIIKAVKSIQFSLTKPISTILDYNLGKKFNCLKLKGTLENEYCVIR